MNSYRLRSSLLVVLAGVLGCENLERFDNQDGSAYCGSIVDASFVRQGFAQHTRLQLQLDTDRLKSLPGRITTDDGADGLCAPEPTFDDAELRVSSKLLADPLSLLSFGESREVNIMAWVDSTCDGSYLAVVSLMRNDNVEVRLMRGEASQEGDEAVPFGVFLLSRFAEECGY